MCSCKKWIRYASAAVAIFAGSSLMAQEDYEGGRGLITLEGPAGMFINPTSGTIPEGYATVQYCVFFPNEDGDLFDSTPAIGHGAIAAYGVADNLELGVQGNLIDPDSGDSVTAVGPFIRYRVMQDVEGGAPEVGVGAYSRFGDEQIQKIGLFAAASKRATFEGPIRSAAVHLGGREVFNEEGAVDENFAAYVGLELELPLRIYAVGEYQFYTQDDDIVAPQDDPHAFGLQWRAGGINMSVAGIANGSLEDYSFYYGVGTALDF